MTSKFGALFGAGFQTALEKLDGTHELQLGVAIQAGAFERPTDGHGLIRYDRDTALVGFFMGMMRELQRLGTALAMDLDVW